MKYGNLAVRLTKASKKTFRQMNSLRFVIVLISLFIVVIESYAILMSIYQFHVKISNSIPFSDLLSDHPQILHNFVCFYFFSSFHAMNNRALNSME